MLNSDPQAVAALAVIQVFDDLLLRGAGLEEVLETAEALVGVGLVVRDDLNDRLIVSPLLRDGCALEPVPDPVPEHGAEEVHGVVVAPVAVAEGRIGVVWTGALSAGSTELQHVAVERLAALAAVDARRLASQSPEPSGSAADELTAAGLDPDAAALLARRVGLPARDDLVPVAARARPGIASEALAAVLGRRAGAGSVTTVAGRTVLLAAPPDAAAALTGLLDDPAVRGWELRIALGVPGPAHQLAAGWASAREGLAFTSSQSPLVRGEELGVLTLLGSLPGDQVLGAADVRAVERVATRGGGDDDLALLARYCEAGSLRETAAALHMHHSSVDYRVKKLERDLGIALDSPRSRMRALLALRLWQLHRPNPGG